MDGFTPMLVLDNMDVHRSVLCHKYPDDIAVRLVEETIAIRCLYFDYKFTNRFFPRMRPAYLRGCFKLINLPRFSDYSTITLPVSVKLININI